MPPEILIGHRFEGPVFAVVLTLLLSACTPPYVRETATSKKVDDYRSGEQEPARDRPAASTDSTGTEQRTGDGPAEVSRTAARAAPASPVPMAGAPALADGKGPGEPPRVGSPSPRSGAKSAHPGRGGKPGRPQTPKVSSPGEARLAVSKAAGDAPDRPLQTRVEVAKMAAGEPTPKRRQGSTAAKSEPAREADVAPGLSGGRAVESADLGVMEQGPLNLAELPIAFGTHWTLDRRKDPLEHKTRCQLISRPVNISDGYERTDVRLQLTMDRLLVLTDSNIDLSYPDTGIRLDGGPLRPFQGLAKETVATLSEDTGGLYQAMATSHSLQVSLGFWPTWPVTQTQVASIPLAGFAAAIEALKSCENSP